jgi:hypothetical protein
MKNIEKILGKDYAYPSKARTLVVKYDGRVFENMSGVLDEGKIVGALDVLRYLCQGLGKKVIAVGIPFVEGGPLYRLEKQALNDALLEKIKPALQEQDPKYHSWVDRISQRIMYKENLTLLAQIENSQAPYIFDTSDSTAVSKLMQEHTRKWSEADDLRLASDDSGLAFLLANYVRANAMIFATEPASKAGRERWLGKMNAISQAAKSNLYVAVGNLGQVAHIAAGEDIGLKFLPDSWANRATPALIGKKAYVRSAFISEYATINPEYIEGSTLEAMMPKKSGLVEASYTMRQLPPIYSLSLKKISSI